MLTLMLGLLFSNKIHEANVWLKKKPEMWEEIEELKIGNIVEDALKRKITSQEARRRTFRIIPIGSKLGEEIMDIYLSVSGSKYKTKPRSINFTHYEDGVLSKFVAFGGKRTQLIIASLQKVFSEVGTEPESLLQFVKSWHGKLWRNKLENKEYFEYAVNFDKDMLKCDAIGIPRKRKPIKFDLEKEVINKMKKKRDAELKSNVISKRERVPDLPPEKKAEIEEIKRKQRMKERKKKLEPKKSLIERELEADKNFKPNSPEDVQNLIKLLDQKKKIKKNMEDVEKKIEKSKKKKGKI